MSDSVVQGTVEYVAKNDDGIKLKETGDTWYNNGLPENQQGELKKKVSDLNQGDKVKLVMAENKPGKYVEVLVTSKSSSSPKKDYGKAPGWTDDYKGIEQLLNKAHEITDGELQIETQVIEVDWDNHRAVCKATVTGITEQLTTGGQPMPLRRKCQGTGDASPESIGTEMIQPHFIRMAETRAIVRALRWYTNQGEVAKEELPQEDIKVEIKEKLEKKGVTMEEAEKVLKEMEEEDKE